MWLAEEADRLAHRIAVVDQGEVISQGTPAELKSNFGASVLEVGFADVEAAAAALAPLTELGGHPAHLIAATVEMTLDGGADNVIHAIRALDQAHLTPTTFAVREPSLDDVFLSLTGRQAVVAIPSNDDEDEADKAKRRRRRSRP